MLAIEFAAPVKETCECCGGMTTRLTRFVYKDNDAFAIYYAMFSDNHPDRVVEIAVGMGDWGEGTVSEDRRAFALKMRDSGNQYEVMVVNADESPWQHAKILGRMLNREEALKHPWIEEIFHITDHMVEEDAAIKAYFEIQH